METNNNVILFGNDITACWNKLDSKNIKTTQKEKLKAIADLKSTYEADDNLNAQKKKYVLERLAAKEAEIRQALPTGKD